MNSGTVTLDVVVAAKKGKPVDNLPQSDFVVLDNSKPQKILRFQEYGKNAAATQMVIVLDDVKTWIYKTWSMRGCRFKNI